MDNTDDVLSISTNTLEWYQVDSQLIETDNL